MSDILPAHWSELRRQHRGYCHSLARECGKLDLVRSPIPLDMHHSAHVAGLQTLAEDVLDEYDAIVFFDHRDSTGGYSTV